MGSQSIIFSSKVLSNDISKYQAISFSLLALLGLANQSSRVLFSDKLTSISIERANFQLCNMLCKSLLIHSLMKKYRMLSRQFMSGYARFVVYSILCGY